MPSRRQPRKGTRKPAVRPKARGESRSHLLVLECDTRKLAADGLNLGSAFGQLAKTFFPSKRIAVVQTVTEQQLKEDLAAVFEEYGRFRSILIVGHSNGRILEFLLQNCGFWSNSRSGKNKLPDFRRHFSLIAAPYTSQQPMRLPVYFSIPGGQDGNSCSGNALCLPFDAAYAGLRPGI